LSLSVGITVRIITLASHKKDWIDESHTNSVTLMTRYIW